MAIKNFHFRLKDETMINRTHILTISLMLASVFQAQADFSFYGHQVQSNLRVQGIRYSSALTQTGVRTLNNRITDAQVLNLSAQIRNATKEFQLDDVGIVLFSRKASVAATTDSYSASILQYRALRSLGYDVILSYTSNEMMVFGRLDHIPASSVYLFYNDKRYTNLDFHNTKTAGRRKIFALPGSSLSKVIKVATQHNPKINADINNRTIVWSHMGKTFRLDAVTNVSLANYLKDIPVMEIGGSYVNRGCSPEFENSVLNGLAKELNAFESTSDKAEFLLAFVQKAFQYQTDEEQFGHEKYNYPEETLVYTFSDCEDRTLLLAFLYKRLLNLNSVALYFKNDKHISLAVAIPDRSNDFSFQYNGVKYVSCEPTGIGFKLGKMGLSLERITEVIEL